MFNLNPKVQNTAIASAVVVVLIWVFKTFINIDVPSEIAAALVTIIGTITGYSTSDK